MADLQIRRYEPSDQDRVWRVHEAAFEAAPIEFIEDPTRTEKLRAIEESYLDGSGEFLVGETGEIVAIGGFAVTDGSTVEISRMRVHPASQRQGYGQALLAALEERAREQGFEVAELGTHVALTAARAFYEANGYHETRRDPHPVAGDTFVYYRKDLDPTR
jgi:ribosomal protein S18 acetylase RimI-like enzyme